MVAPTAASRLVIGKGKKGGGGKPAPVGKGPPVGQKGPPVGQAPLVLVKACKGGKKGDASKGAGKKGEGKKGVGVVSKKNFFVPAHPKAAEGKGRNGAVVKGTPAGKKGGGKKAIAVKSPAQGKKVDGKGKKAATPPTKPCRYGAVCYRLDCHFRHPPGWNPEENAKKKSKAKGKPEAAEEAGQEQAEADECGEEGGDRQQEEEEGAEMGEEGDMMWEDDEDAGPVEAGEAAEAGAWEEQEEWEEWEEYENNGQQEPADDVDMEGEAAGAEGEGEGEVYEGYEGEAEAHEEAESTEAPRSEGSGVGKDANSHKLSLEAKGIFVTKASEKAERKLAAEKGATPTGMAGQGPSKSARVMKKGDRAEGGKGGPSGEGKGASSDASAPQGQEPDDAQPQDEGLRDDGEGEGEGFEEVNEQAAEEAEEEWEHQEEQQDWEEENEGDGAPAEAEGDDGQEPEELEEWADQPHDDDGEGGPGEAGSFWDERFLAEKDTEGGAKEETKEEDEDEKMKEELEEDGGCEPWDGDIAPDDVVFEDEGDPAEDEEGAGGDAGELSGRKRPREGGASSHDPRLVKRERFADIGDDVMDDEAQGQSEEKPLPIRDVEAEVMRVVCSDAPVVLVHGEPGCGKSRIVPQLLLENASANEQAIRIAVVQPRRIAAASVASKVVEDLGESDFGSSIGCRMGGVNKPGNFVDYCTVGYMLQLFSNQPEEFERYTHIILDELHERTMEVDLLMMLVRLLVKLRFQTTRIVLMSSTLQTSAFAAYFSPGKGNQLPPQVFAGKRPYEVKTIFLDELTLAFGGKLKSAKSITLRIQEHQATLTAAKRAGDKAQPAGRILKVEPRHVEKLHTVIVEVIQHLRRPGSTILVFLPGIEEISSLWEALQFLEDSGKFCVLPFHHLVPLAEQEFPFKTPASGITNVVLATEMAESSLTLPEVIAVIDTGLRRRVERDHRRGVSMSITRWISCSGATHRAGRVGRTRPGTVIRLFTRDFFEKTLEQEELPEVALAPVDKLALQVVNMCEKLRPSLGDAIPDSAASLARELIQVPNSAAFTKARMSAVALGALLTKEGVPDRLTALGRMYLTLPMGIELSSARLMWLGTHMGVPADAMVLAAVMNSLDPFSSPSPAFIRQQREYIERLRATMLSRWLFDGGQLSEPLMYRQLFTEWLATFQSPEGRWESGDDVFRARRQATGTLSSKFPLSKGRTEVMVAQVLDLAQRTFRACQSGCKAAKSLQGLLHSMGYAIDDQGDIHGTPGNSWSPSPAAEIFGEDPAFLKGLLAAAQSDNIILGTYGGLPSLHASKADREKRFPNSSEAEQRLKKSDQTIQTMLKLGFRTRLTMVFPGTVKDAGNIGKYVESVVVHQLRPNGIRPVTITGAQELLLEVADAEASRDAKLQCRARAPLLDSPLRLPPEFLMLLHYEKAVAEHGRRSGAAPSDWDYEVRNMWHPCLISWECMSQTPSGISRRAGFAQTAAVLNMANPVGFVGHVASISPHEPLQKELLLGVASTFMAGDVQGRVFAANATVLGPRHMGFLLSTVPVSEANHGLLRIAFMTDGAVSVLHRAVDLPAGCLGKTQWAMVSDLRNLLRLELMAAEGSLGEDVWDGSPLLFADTRIESCARALHEATAVDLEAAREGKQEFAAAEVSRWTVALGADAFGNSAEMSPMEPLAKWSWLVKRREVVMKQGGRLTHLAGEPAPSAGAARGPEAVASQKGLRLVPAVSAPWEAAPAKGGKKAAGKAKGGGKNAGKGKDKGKGVVQTPPAPSRAAGVIPPAVARPRVVPAVAAVPQRRFHGPKPEVAAAALRGGKSVAAQPADKSPEMGAISELLRQNGVNVKQLGASLMTAVKVLSDAKVPGLSSLPAVLEAATASAANARQPASGADGHHASSSSSSAGPPYGAAASGSAAPVVGKAPKGGKGMKAKGGKGGAAATPPGGKGGYEAAAPPRQHRPEPYGVSAAGKGKGSGAPEKRNPLKLVPQERSRAPGSERAPFQAPVGADPRGAARHPASAASAAASSGEPYRGPPSVGGRGARSYPAAPWANS